MRKKVLFELSAYEDLKNWQKIDRKTYRTIINILKNIDKYSLTKFQESESLKRELNGYSSITIKDEHRLVFKITATRIIIIACRYHYH